jgi:hypothetical protein
MHVKLILIILDMGVRYTRLIYCVPDRVIIFYSDNVLLPQWRQVLLPTLQSLMSL